MSTIFARAEGVMDLSPLSDEERVLFFERMRNTVVVTFRVRTRKRRRGGRGAGRGARAGRGVGAGSARDGVDIATAEDDNRYGTGFVINSQVYVLTCASNIEGAGNSIVEVKYFGDEKLKVASIFFKDSKKNMVILRPKELPDRVYYTELAGVEGEDDNVYLVMQVYCIGHPTGLIQSVYRSSQLSL